MLPSAQSGFGDILNPAIPQLVPSRNTIYTSASFADSRSQINHAGPLSHCDVDTACLLLPGCITSLDWAEVGPGYTVLYIGIQ